MLLSWRIVSKKTSRSRYKIQYDVCHASYDRVNNSVFRRFLNVSIDVDDVTDCGRLFHTRTAATGNARSPIDECLVRGTINDAVADERIRRPLSHLKHGGVQPLGTEDTDHVNTCRQKLPVESHFAPVLVTNVAHEEVVWSDHSSSTSTAALSTDCNLSSCVRDRPASITLP